MSPAKSLTLGVFAALAAIAGLVAAQYWSTAKNPQLETGTLLREPRAIADFQLKDSSGAVFDRSRFVGHWSLVFVGFTYCPDVCPSTLGVLKSLHARLEAEKLPLQTVFVSVDPERDSLEKLGRYVHYFDPAFIGATGSTAQLDVLTQSLSLVYAKVPGSSPTDYTLDHSAALVLINPDAQVAAYFLPPHRLDAMTKDLAGLLRERPA